MPGPERLVVGHPFNPVYLLPLVEIVAGRKTSAETVARAKSFYQSIGMKPLVVRKEIDAFVGDRLLEAFWREALWLVHDDVATAEEIDDVVRYSFGLRWAQMGTFMVYRIAGGEAGMRHFMSQFGPALRWPWTKLTDVPNFTPALVDKIVAQSDAQAAGHSIRELERLRAGGAALIAVLWPAFGWLEHYAGLREHLEAGYACVHRDDAVIAFDLRRAGGTPAPDPVRREAAR
jgi:carnitine 3-dehydrogenase